MYIIVYVIVRIVIGWDKVKFLGFIVVIESFHLFGPLVVLFFSRFYEVVVQLIFEINSQKMLISTSNSTRNMIGYANIVRTRIVKRLRSDWL